MPEVAKMRHDEFNNLRPVILVACFFWGVAIGFALNFFRPPEVDPQAQAQRPAAQTQAGSGAEATKQPSELERRRAGAPAIAAIEPAPQPASTAKPSFENAIIEAPPVALTTDGGLTGKNAPKPRLSGPAGAPPGATPAAPVMPLIPDLDP